MSISVKTPNNGVCTVMISINEFGLGNIDWSEGNVHIWGIESILEFNKCIYEVLAKIVDGN